MPQNTTVAVPANTWTEITNADVTNISFQVGDFTKVKGTVGSVAPTDDDGALEYTPGTGEVNLAVADMWLGVTGVNRVWVKCSKASRVVVSHA